MAKILVLDGHSAAALATTRSAGHAGHWVAVGANRGVFAAAKLSRFCQSTFDYPVSTDDADAFVESVLEFARGHAIELVVPITDWTLGPLSAQRDRFNGVCRLAVPPHRSLEPAADKHRTLVLAESLGIEVPRTWLIESTADLAPLAHISFPAVVKDRFSVRWLDGKALFGSVAYAHSLSDLENKVTERLGAAGDVLVQEFVSGLGIGFSCFIAHGEVFLPFQWQRVREVDPRGSASSCRRSVPLDAETVSLSGRLIAQIGFEGIAMVEYKKMKDGRLILMEINGRPWGSISLPVACGIDYPRHLIEWCLQGTLPPLSIPYRENIVCRRIVGELTHLSNLRAGPPPNWPIPYPNYWTSLVTMAVPWLPGVCYDDLWLSDLRPGIAGIGNWFRSRMKGKLGS
ncbi:MAG: ATP-grasp domain-containing protein [Candidatus Sulfotelmatobacter sp.]